MFLDCSVAVGGLHVENPEVTFSGCRGEWPMGLFWKPVTSSLELHWSQGTPGPRGACRLSPNFKTHTKSNAFSIFRAFDCCGAIYKAVEVL